jgi:hypothetical protein
MGAKTEFLFGRSTATIPEMPDTGVTRTYDWTISRGTIAPDGVTKFALLVNNQFPGTFMQTFLL